MSWKNTVPGLWATLLKSTDYSISYYYNSVERVWSQQRVGNVQEGFWEEEALGRVFSDEKLGLGGF